MTEQLIKPSTEFGTAPVRLTAISTILGAILIRGGLARLLAGPTKGSSP